MPEDSERINYLFIGYLGKVYSGRNEGTIKC